MKSEDILEINDKAPENQGVFFEPNGIPHSIKEHVVYMRWHCGGSAGAGCHEHNRSYDYEESRPGFEALDLVLEKLGFVPTDEQMKEIESWVVEGDRDWESEDYYMNHEEWQTEWIPLSKVEKLVESFKTENVIKSYK